MRARATFAREQNCRTVGQPLTTRQQRTDINIFPIGHSMPANRPEKPTIIVEPQNVFILYQFIHTKEVIASNTGSKLVDCEVCIRFEQHGKSIEIREDCERKLSSKCISKPT